MVILLEIYHLIWSFMPVPRAAHRYGSQPERRGQIYEVFFCPSPWMTVRTGGFVVFSAVFFRGREYPYLRTLKFKG